MGISRARVDKHLVWKMKLILKLFSDLPQYAWKCYRCVYYFDPCTSVGVLHVPVFLYQIVRNTFIRKMRVFEPVHVIYRREVDMFTKKQTYGIFPSAVRVLFFRKKRLKKGLFFNTHFSIFVFSKKSTFFSVFPMILSHPK